MSDKVDKKKLNKIKEDVGLEQNQFIAMADQWLREQGIISDYAKNAIIINLYTNFPKAQMVEFYLDQEEKMIEVHLHFKLWHWLFARNTTLTDRTTSLIKQYLPDFKITAEKRRYDKRRQQD